MPALFFRTEIFSVIDMQAKINKVGRPCNGNKDVRKELIKYARHLFTIIPYEKVSTRLISSKAGVSSR